MILIYLVFNSLAIKLLQSGVPQGPWLTIKYQSDNTPYQPKIETYPQVYKTQSLNY